MIVGDPTDANTQVGALISREHLKKVLSYVDAAKAAGAQLVCGGEQVTENGLVRRVTLYAQPCLPTVLMICPMLKMKYLAR